MQHILQEFLNFIKKIFLNLQFFNVLDEAYKSREIPVEFYYLIEKCIKKVQNCSDRGLLEIDENS